VFDAIPGQGAISINKGAETGHITEQGFDSGSARRACPSDPAGLGRGPGHQGRSNAVRPFKVRRVSAGCGSTAQYIEGEAVPLAWRAQHHPPIISTQLLADYQTRPLPPYDGWCSSRPKDSEQLGQA
jgi:hypothetical protein